MCSDLSTACLIDASSQDYFLALSDSALQGSFTWMMNNDVDLAGTGKWVMVPTTLRLPSELPKQLRCYGSAWEISGEPQSPLKSSVKEGVFLTLRYLEQIRSILKFPLPDKGKGSGAGGGIVKVNYAVSLVKSLWPDDTDQEKTRMVDVICGRNLSKVKCASDVISAVKELGAEGERDFSDLHQVALNQELVEIERKLRSPTEDREERKTYTPNSLKDFIPNAPGVACSRNPILLRYQAFYPGSLEYDLHFSFYQHYFLNPFGYIFKIH